MLETDGGTGSSPCECGLWCPRCPTTPSNSCDELSCWKTQISLLKRKTKHTKKNPTFQSRQFFFCLISLHSTSCLGSHSDPLGQRSESTAISSWQHLHSLFYPGRSEQMLEIKSIRSQTPIFKAQTEETEENARSISQPFNGAVTKNVALLCQVLWHQDVMAFAFVVLTFQVNTTLLVFSSSLSQNFWINLGSFFSHCWY